MIVRPLELASRLRPELRSLDWLHVVNVALLVLFFDLLGSRFVLAPGLRVELPQMPGARATATTTTHYISVTQSGLIFITEGPVKLEGLRTWLKEEGAKTKNPVLLVRAARGGQIDVLADIASAAAAAGFSVVWAFDEPLAEPAAERRK